MHIRHVKELSTKITHCKNVESMKHFASKISTLCKRVLRDCCIQLEGCESGVERAASAKNHAVYLEIHPAIPKDIAGKYQQLCSSSEESIIKIFLTVIPHLIQSIKEIFVDKGISEVQNGLRGLSEERLKEFLSEVQEAEQTNKIRHLVCALCQILARLCMKNRGKTPASEIMKWSEGLGILSMLKFLKHFFQHCKQDVRLHKRLDLFSRRLTEIMSDDVPVDIADEFFVRDFSNVLLSVITFSKFSPSKLVRFELTDSTNAPVLCDRQNNNFDLQYDRPQKTFSQYYEIRKESEDELQLFAVARVHFDGRICEKGAFQSAIVVNASGEEAFDSCIARFVGVATVKLKDLDYLRVILCSAQKEKLIEVLNVLEQELSGEVLDLRRSPVTECRLALRTTASKAGEVVSLRLAYEWGSDALVLDSNDFEAFAYLSTGDDCMQVEKHVGKKVVLVWIDLLRFSLFVIRVVSTISCYLKILVKTLYVFKKQGQFQIRKNSQQTERDKKVYIS